MAWSTLNRGSYHIVFLNLCYWRFKYMNHLIPNFLSEILFLNTIFELQVCAHYFNITLSCTLLVLEYFHFYASTIFDLHTSSISHYLLSWLEKKNNFGVFDLKIQMLNVSDRTNIHEVKLNCSIMVSVFLIG